MDCREDVRDRHDKIALLFFVSAIHISPFILIFLPSSSVSLSYLAVPCASVRENTRA